MALSLLQYLHGLNIVYRDLKPENLLIGPGGYLKLTDFGFAKILKEETWTLCGTPEYLAPEIVQSKGHGISVDCWALGILMYEMLCGYAPFYDENPCGIYEKIVIGKFEFPKHVDEFPRDIIKRLLILDKTKRLSCINGADGTNIIRRHKFFRGVDWNTLPSGRIHAPIIPKIALSLVHHWTRTRSMCIRKRMKRTEMQTLGSLPPSRISSRTSE